MPSETPMSESELKRTVHRGVAVVLLPLSLLLVQMANVTSGAVDSSLPGVSRAVGLAVFAVAALYLAVSGSRQLAAAADTPF
jgi:hypothetical protein